MAAATVAGKTFFLNGEDEDEYEALPSSQGVGPAMPYQINTELANGRGGQGHASSSTNPPMFTSSDDLISRNGDTEDDEDDLSTTSGRRHGALLLPEEADMIIFDQPYMTQWTQKRHQTGGNPKPRDERDLPDWRMRERLRTVTAALVMCLNLGVDPPDVSKTNPCSKLICWTDPGSLDPTRALEAIGKNMVAQFEHLSMKTRYKLHLDPVVEEMKRFCTSLRRTAKDERVLFYYNGYGVPKPTPGGEIWVFNKAYTQYIPVTLYDLQAWLGNPCIFVWDASSAGNILNNFKRLAERRADEESKSSSNGKKQSTMGEDQQFPLRESIHLAACGPDDVLPMNPDLPADLFTSCLTSPIEISLRWFVLQNPLPSPLDFDMIMKIPGRLQDRRTPLGELNWIFTAITDTIAWTVLPRTIFRRLFRDDLMVAALLRNFLLAERIMRFYHCSPMSHPKLPPTHNHPLWDSWDLAVDQCLSQLPTLLAKTEAAEKAAEPDGPAMPAHLAAFEYQPSTFFSEQLMAFEVWLSQGGVSRKGRRRRADASLSIAAQLEIDQDEEDEEEARLIRDPPDQLPIVLQVLLSQVHRLRALILLSQFLDLGPWAVNLALSIGIFPYVLKLLQSPAADLKPVLIYIWARILAVDRSCQNDLLRDNGFIYFSTVLSPFQQPNGINDGTNASNVNNYPIPNVSEHRAMCAFILSVFCQDFPAGQQACLQTDAMDSCLEHLDHDDFLLRQWSALCIGQLWDDSAVGKARGISKDVHGKFACMLSDISPEVRAAVLYAMGILLGASGSSHDPNDPSSSLPTNPISSKHAQTRPHCLGTGTMLNMEESRQRSLEIGIAISMLSTKCDSSPLVRKELVIALSPLVREYQGFFVLAAYLYYNREERKMRRRMKTSLEEISGLDPESKAYEQALLTRVLIKLSLEEGLDEIDIANVPAFSTLFVALLDLSADSHPEVASMASTVVDYITALILTSIPFEFSTSTGGAGDRLVTPTSTAKYHEGYFPPMPRSKMSVGNDRPSERESVGLTSTQSLGGLSTFTTSSGQTITSGNRPSSHHASQQRRNTSLAQTVKTIATLGYSRPPSPSSSSPDETQPQSESVVPPRSAFLPARVPAPRSNSSRYISPFGPDLSNRDASLPSSPKTPVTPMSTNGAYPTSAIAPSSDIAHRSASAESLAHITRLQERRSSKAGSIRQSANLNQTYNTPSSTSSARSPSADKIGSLSMIPSQSHSHDMSTRSRSPAEDIERMADIKMADALAAIVAQDLHRFRDRAQIIAAKHNTANAGNTPMHSPSIYRADTSSGAVSPGTPSSTTGGGFSGSRHVREVLPLKSRLFVWCSEYYTEPQMKCAEADELGSVQYNIQTWKRERNEGLMNEAQVDVESAMQIRWTQKVQQSIQPNASSTGVQVGGPAYLMHMHQFENHLITASEQDTLSVWDWTTGKLLTKFNNGNPPKTSITSLTFANEEAQSRLLVGSADGDVRIYANYDEPSWTSNRGPKLVSSMRALPHLVRSKRPSGLILDWQQITGSLLTGGDSRYVRVWDAHRELCICDIPTRVSSCVTSISSESDVGHIFVCGFGDGAIGVYDRRIPPELSLVRLWEEHANWVTNVHLQKRGNRELVSASTDGVVKVWDIRGRKSIRSKDWSEQLHGKLSAMEVHDGAPLFALSNNPRPTRQGLSAQRTLLCNIETQEILSNVSPIVRQFATPAQAAQLAANQHQPAGGAHYPIVQPTVAQSNANPYSTNGIPNKQGHPQSNTSLLSPAIDSPPSPFRPSMGALAFHPHFPLLAFSGPDLQGHVGFIRGQAGAPSTSFHPPSAAATFATASSGGIGNKDILLPYTHMGSGGYGILDGDDQRHIPSFTNTSSENVQHKGLLARFSS